LNNPSAAAAEGETHSLRTVAAVVVAMPATVVMVAMAAATVTVAAVLRRRRNSLFHPFHLFARKAHRTIRRQIWSAAIFFRTDFRSPLPWP